MGRIQKLRSGLDVGSMTGIEIAPLFQPAVTKEEGDVIYVDHVDAESLKAKYADDSYVDISKIVSVDAIWGSQTLLEAVGRRVDYVIASHVAEHVPDLVGWLREIREVLHPGGTLRLTVPDKRFTFDINRRETALADVLEAHAVKTRIPLPRAIIEYMLQSTTVDLAAVWEGRYQPKKRSCDVAGAINVARDAQENGTYHDVHCWVFTPAGFCRLLERLASEGLVEYRCDAFHDTQKYELDFTVIMCPCEDPAEASRSWANAAASAQDLPPAPQAATPPSPTIDDAIRRPGRIRRLFSRYALIPPFGRLQKKLIRTTEKLASLQRRHDALQQAYAALQVECSHLLDGRTSLPSEPLVSSPLRIIVTRAEQHWEIAPALFEVFAFRTGDQLTVVPADQAAKLPAIWGDVVVPIEPGRSVRVPHRMVFHPFKNFQIPAHLISLTGAGPETLDEIGKAHIANYKRIVGIDPGMTVLEIGCGIGRDALQLTDVLSKNGAYIGIDVTRDSILWCKNNITEHFGNFSSFHIDAENELYNPFGTKSTTDFQLPCKDCSVDRIVAASVFTHLFEIEIVHYMKEFRRVLKPTGLAYVTFFLYSDETIAAARKTNLTPWKVNFDQVYGGGFFGNDPTFPRGAVAFTDAAMRRMLDRAGLKLVKPYLKGWWSGLHKEPDDGQDGAVLATR
jgi:SAM-dependent methyltransferase